MESRCGCAYFGFIDTDLVKTSYSHPSAEALNRQSPGFLRNPAPLSSAVDAIERGIERRAARLWAPRWVGAAITLRGILQPLTERRILRNTTGLSEAMRLADPASSDVPEADPLLGVSAQAITQPERTPRSRPTSITSPRIAITAASSSGGHAPAEPGDARVEALSRAAWLRRPGAAKTARRIGSTA